MKNRRLVSGGLPAADTSLRMVKENFGNDHKIYTFKNNIFHIN
jgi:hypothetical protein